MKKCVICNSDILKKDSESNLYFEKKKYCSSSCYGKSKIGLSSPRKGKKLNESQLKKHSEIRIGKRCGENSPRWNGGMISKICKECSRIFSVKPYRRYSAKFCSKICKTNNSNTGKTSENEKIRKSTDYKKWRKLVFERDDYTCVICGKNGGCLNADHIKPFSLYPELRLDIDNGRTHCTCCHKKTDTYGVKKLAFLNNF